MASGNPAKRRVPGSGRVTPKGGSPTRRGNTGEPAGESSRYTPPVPGGSRPPSPPWVPVTMFGLLGAGMAVIILNYVSLLPGAVSNWYLLVGLVLILGGIITATQYR